MFWSRSVCWCHHPTFLSLSALWWKCCSSQSVKAAARNLQWAPLNQALTNHVNYEPSTPFSTLFNLLPPAFPLDSVNIAICVLHYAHIIPPIQRFSSLFPLSSLYSPVIFLFIPHNHYENASFFLTCLHFSLFLYFNLLIFFNISHPLRRKSRNMKSEGKCIVQ